MSELPFLYQYVRSWGMFEYKDIYIDLRNGSPIIQFYNKVYGNHSSDYSSEAKIAIEFINLCILEISSHKIDTSKFIKKERIYETETDCNDGIIPDSLHGIFLVDRNRFTLLIIYRRL